VSPCCTKTTLATLLSLLLVSTLHAQLTVNVTKVPANTPANATLYMACNLNNWAPNHPNYLLTHRADGTYSITLDMRTDTLRYKFTRGTWPSVEGNKIGKLIPDRIMLGPLSSPTTVTARIQSWEDLAATSYYDIFIDRIPVNTPDSTELYLTGNFNDWNPKDLLYQFTKRDDGHWHVRLPFMLDTLSFKITRGSWDTVEGNERGEMITNREFITQDYTSMTIHTNVLGWEDLPPSKYFNLLVTDVPQNTPVDATLYLCGSFNGWQYGDEAYRLEQNSDGSYSINISSASDTVHYLINRGSALATECNIDGSPRQYRQVVYPNPKNGLYTTNEELLAISAWHDLPGPYRQLYTTTLAVPLVLAAFVLLMLAGQFAKKHMVRMASLTLIGVCLTLGAQLLATQPWGYVRFTQLTLLPFIGMLSIPPALYLYLLALLAHRHKVHIKDWLHTLPLVLVLFMLLPLFISSSTSFNKLASFGQLNWVFAAANGIAYTVALVYCLAGAKLWNQYRVQNLQNAQAQTIIHHAKNLLLYSAVMLAVWLAVLLIPLANQITATDTTTAATVAGYLAWLLVGGYVMIIMRAMAGANTDFFNFTGNQNRLKNTEHFFLTKQLQEVMANDKPYLNPRLTLTDLAQICHVPAQQMSRALNEGFGKNFYDYINQHRITEFKHMVNLDENKQKTVLEIAYKVGFSSKTTFNRAFKKSTGLTPSEYLKTGQATHTPQN